jgi:phospholipid/cholesterol/gamma-HCH transport system substrate-binding protein
MPIENKATWARLRVGIMAIAALIILGVLIFLLSSTNGFFKSQITLYTYMDSSSAIAKGSPVRLNGILVGKVKDLELTGSTQPGRIVKLTLEVDRDFQSQIPVDSKAEVTALNLLGANYINIAKGTNSQTVQSGAELTSAAAMAIADFMKQGSTMLGGVQDVVTKVQSILTEVESGKGTLGKIIYGEEIYNQATAIMTQIQKLTETLNSNRGIGKFINDDTLYDEFRGTVARANNLIDGINQGQGTLGKIVKDPAMYDDAVKAIADLRKSMAKIDTILADVNDGKGDVGKFFKTEELHEEIKATMGRLDSIMDKINSGQGTIGQLLVNPSVYESVDGLTREMNSLMKDFRANPKKFLTIQLKLF